MDAAMRRRRGLPDRVPLMCQLALGHYFLQAGLDPIDVWHDTAAFGDGLLQLCRRYRFDGVLVNLPGRPPHWRTLVSSVTAGAGEGERIVRWATGARTIVVSDDNPHTYPADSGCRFSVPLEAVDPDRLFYIEPHDVGGVTYPTRWSFASEPAIPGDGFFPRWHWDTLRYVRERAPWCSVHGEVFSPLSQLMELGGYESTLAALILAPDRVTACLDRLADGAITLALGHLAAGADAVLISSAFAGAGFLSRAHYRRFVLPHERKVIDAVRRARPEAVLYTHTCGAIGDRLDLMEATGTDGIDTLDPPPLGTVHLAEAKAWAGDRLFLKGNLDPVGTLLQGTEAECFEAAIDRIRTGKPGGGYILSSACSVAPRTPPANLARLASAIDACGAYG
jgi:hypothetical protein